MHGRDGVRAITRAFTFLASGAFLGCSAQESAPEQSRASLPADSVAAVATSAWYSGVRVLDLTGDGQPDTARLQARGDKVDSLEVTLALVVDGSEAHREQWGSSYELQLLDSASRQAPGVDQVLRAKLDSVLASVRVRRLDDPGTRLMLEDSAALAGLDPRPTQLISFSYGFESTTRLVWDGGQRRFVRLWSCC